jgi:hypothetical protein
LSTPWLRDALTDHEQKIVDAWLRRYNDRRMTQ